MVSSAHPAGVGSDHLEIPEGACLADVTVDLTRLLGDPDPRLRERLALPALTTWIEHGVYDDLLPGLGDGIALGLRTGIGERGTDTVLRRSSSAVVLGCCVARDTQTLRVPQDRVLDWGDRLVTWFLDERDLRADEPGLGAPGALTRGADALAALACSPHLGAGELQLLLDVIAQRVLALVDQPLGTRTADRLAAAVLAVLGRDLLGTDALEPWLDRLVAGASARSAREADAPVPSGDTETLLRSLYLQLSLGPARPAVRSDLLIAVVAALRATNPRDLPAREDAASI